MARVKKAEKKTWYPIVAPKIFHNQVVGEILLTSPTNAVGRIVPVNLANLARDPRRQHITIKLAISTAAGEKLHTDIIGYQMSPSFLKRMARKGVNKVDYVFSTETADDKKLKLKAILVTRRKVNMSVTTALRKKAEELVKKEAKKTKFAEFIQLIIAHKIQGSIKKQLGKVYPLKTFEIRHLKVEEEKGHQISKKVKKEEFKEAPVEELKKEETKKKEIKPETKEAPKEEKTEVKEEPKKES